MLPRPNTASLKTQDPTFTINQISRPHLSFDWHQHGLTEITFFIKGQGLRFVGDHVGNYHPNQISILGPNLPHTCVSQNQIEDTAHQMISLHFDEGGLSRTVFNVPEMWPIKALLAKSSGGLLFDCGAGAEFGEVIGDLLQAKGPRKIILFLDVLDSITLLGPAEALTSSHYNWAHKSHDQERLKSTLKFLSENYTQPIHLENLAKIAHMSPSAFSRFFKKQTRQTPSAMINHLRVSLACKLLSQTSKPILEICYASGFHNVSNFNRRFKDHQGVSPREFRKIQAVGMVQDHSQTLLPQ